jgi:hypothetical protein
MADILTVQLNERQMRDVERMLVAVPKAVPRIIVRASNKAAITVRADMARRVSRVLGLKVSSVKRYQVFLDKATKTRLVAHVGASNWPTKAGYLRPRQLKRGVKFGGPGGRRLIEGAFIARMKSGHLGVYLRRGPARLPIVEQHAQSAGGILKPMEAEIAAKAGGLLEKNIAAQVQLMLEREAAKRGVA